MATTTSAATMSFPDILTKMRMGTISYEDAVDAAIAAYQSMFSGYTPETARAAAVNWLLSEGFTAGTPAPTPELPPTAEPPVTTPVAPITPTTPATPTGFTPEERAEKLAEMEAAQEGRQIAFLGYLQRRLPSYMPASARSFKESQFEPLQARWLTRRGMGIPGTFAEFVGGQPGAFSPEDWRGAVRQVAGLYPTEQETSEQYGARQEGWGLPTRGMFKDIRLKPQMGYDIALQSALPNVPIPFRNAYEDYARRQWAAFQSQTPDLPFLPWFAGKGYKF